MDDSMMLLELYGKFSRMKNDIGEEHCQKINASHPDFKNQVCQRIQDLHRKDEAVIIAGETSAGKSSLMNLLLGCKLCSVSNKPATDKIYRVHNSNDKRVVCKGGKGEVTHESSHDDLKSLESILRKTVSKSSENLFVDIYLPIPEAKGKVVLVDTPGIGDSQEHTEILMSYIPNAVAFVFIVNVSSAGGFQDGRLLDIFKRIEDRRQEMPCFNPKDVLFVMNKCDRIEKHEHDEILQSANKSLYEAWPYVSMAPENTFHVSLKQLKGGNSPEFATEFDRFKNTLYEMMGENANKRIKDHSRYLEGLVFDAKCSLLATIHQENKRYENEIFLEEVDKKRTTFIEKSNELRTIFDEKAKSLARRCQTYMSSDDFHQKVLENAAARRFTMSPEMELQKSFMKQLEEWSKGEYVKVEVEEIDLKIKDLSKEANDLLQSFMEKLTGQSVESLFTAFDVTWFVGEFLEALPKALSFHVGTLHVSKPSWWLSTKYKREQTIKQPFELMLDQCSGILIRVFKNTILLFFSEKIKRIIENLVRKCDFIKMTLHQFKGTPKLNEDVLSKLKTIVNDLQDVSLKLTQIQK